LIFSICFSVFVSQLANWVIFDLVLIGRARKPTQLRHFQLLTHQIQYVKAQPGLQFLISVTEIQFSVTEMQLISIWLPIDQHIAGLHVSLSSNTVFFQTQKTFYY